MNGYCHDCGNILCICNETIIKAADKVLKRHSSLFKKLRQAELKENKMKTCVFTNMYFQGNDPCGRPRMERALKWLKYIISIQDRLWFEQIYISVNGGTADQIATILRAYPEVKLIRHNHLERGQGHDYLPCWRTTQDYRMAINDGYDKIIMMDDDAFILSDKLIRHVHDLKTGWESMWCPRWNFPECGLSVLCKDTFPAYLKFAEIPYYERNESNEPIECMLPYTNVNKGVFNTDRFGELRLQQEPGMDAYFQCPIDIEMKVEEE